MGLSGLNPMDSPAARTFSMVFTPTKGTGQAFEV